MKTALIKLSKWLFLSSLVLLRFSSECQAILSIDKSVEQSYTHDTVYLGQSDSVHIRIINIGVDTFRGQIGFSSVIDTNGNSEPTNIDTGQQDINHTGIGINTPNDTVGPGDTVQEYIYFNFGTPVWVPGSSVVVIWPSIISGGAQWTDSITLHFIIDSAKVDTSKTDTGTAAIAPLGPEKLDVYSYGSEIRLIYDPQNGPAYVRIYNTLGALLIAQNINAPENIISMGEYASGLYYVEVTLPDQSQREYKIFNLNK